MKNIQNTVLACAMGALLAGPAVAQSVTIVLAHEEPADATTSAAHMSAMVFKDIIETRSNGDMVVDIQGASTMGNQRERMELTQADIIQVNIAAIGGLAQFYPAINAIDLPFAFPDEIVADHVFDGPFGDMLAENIYATTDLRLLAVTAGDFYVFTNSTREVRSPADMNGLRVRTMSVPSHLAMMNALGAAATPVPWDELYSALETGVVDAQHNPIPIVAIGNLQEVQRYATVTNHLYGADWWVTSDLFLNGLTAEQMRIFTNAVEAARTAGRGAKMGLRATKFGTTFLEESGIQVYAPTPEELSQFRDLAAPAVMSVLADEIGDDAVALAEAMLEAVATAEREIYGAD